MTEGNLKELDKKGLVKLREELKKQIKTATKKIQDVNAELKYRNIKEWEAKGKNHRVKKTQDERTY